MARRITADPLRFFCSVIVCLYPTNEFYKNFNSVEYSNIIYSFFNIVKAIFKENLEITSLPSDKETLYIIINTDQPDMASRHITSAIDKLHNLLQHDMELVELYTGIGGTYMDIQGLKQSHAEAIKSLKKLPTPTHISLSKSGKTTNPTDIPQMMAMITPIQLICPPSNTVLPIGYLNSTSLTNGARAVAKNATCIFSEIFFFIAMQKIITPTNGIHILRKFKP